MITELVFFKNYLKAQMI